MKNLAPILLVALLAAGCVSRKPFTFEFSPRSTAFSGTNTVAFRPTTDQRGRTNLLDRILEIPGGLDEIITREVEATGRFARVVKMAAGQTGRSEDFELEVALKKLEWEIPNHDKMVGTAFGVSVLTGGIGGLIYGSTETEVFGHAKLAFKLTATQTTKVVFEREYSGDTAEKLSKFNCDTAPTGRRLAGKAVKSAIEQFKQDLVGLSLDLID